MKKWLISILVILICFIVAAYVLIPNTIQVNQGILIKANRDGLYRNLSDKTSWSKWWPGDKSSAQDGLLYNDAAYSVADITTLSIVVSIRNHQEIKTSLTPIAKNFDSSALNWQASMPTSYNPFKRVQIYFNSKKISNDMVSLLKKMQSYFAEIKNVYGCDIHLEQVKDSTLVSTYGTSKTYPSTELIYDLIGQLKEYIVSRSAIETGFPMLNIYKNDSGNYLTRVAIPVDKKLPTSGNISYKWMLGGGNILVADVQGGQFSINIGFRQLENYLHDYHRVPPAIPFQALITDRSKIPDTTKWITRLYYPVM